MIVGKVLSILDVSIKVILSTDELEIGDILTTKDGKYNFEVVSLTSVEATCITLESNWGLKKGEKLYKKAKGITSSGSDDVGGSSTESGGTGEDGGGGFS